MPQYSPDFLRLIEKKVPALMLIIILKLLLNPTLHVAGPIDAAELFAGMCSVTMGLKRAGLVSIAFEKNMSPLMDLLTPQGFCLAISLVLRMGIGGRGLLWLAPVCSTWIFLSTGTTLRSKINPSGDTSLRCVREANTMTSRCVLLMALADAMNITYILEQPTSSVMVYYDRMQWLAALHSMYTITPVCMGAFGGDSPNL